MLAALGMLLIGVLAWLFPGSASAAFPDARRYELVSPQDKNGGDVLAVSRRTRASSSGDAVGFASLVGFADIFGMGFSADYVAMRGRSGWSTHGITPRQEPQSLGLVIGPGDRMYVSEFSDDFEKGVARVTEFPGVPANVATVQNLLLREDLLTPGLGRYQLLSNSVNPIPVQRRGTPAAYRPLYVDASADFGHVVFQSSLNLLADTGSNLQKLYDWDHGTLRLVGVLPDGTVSENAVAGRGVSGARSGYVERIISDDGSRIYFTVQNSPAVEESVGSPDGQLYLREGAGSTVQVNASEKGSPDAPQPAEFWTASSDGRFAFFTTAEQLVDDDRDSNPDLYRFDAEAPARSRLRVLSVDGEPDDGASGLAQMALGASEDGQRVYFIVEGNQLVDGAPIPSSTVSGLVYLWDAGQLKYVGKVHRFDRDALPGSDTTAKTVRVSPDGRHMVFLTIEGDQEVPHEHGPCGVEPCRQLYFYSADANGGAGGLTCVSCPPDGSPGTASAAMDSDAGQASSGRAIHINRSLSEDGARVFFTTAQALVKDDHNANRDVYEYTAAARTLRLISSGHAGAGDALFMDASSDGNDVFFTTREALVGADQDAAVDLYDARAGGGFVEPPVSQPCQEHCQAPPTLLPALQVPPTIAFQGTGNVGRRGRS